MKIKIMSVCIATLSTLTKKIHQIVLREYGRFQIHQGHFGLIQSSDRRAQLHNNPAQEDPMKQQEFS